MSLAASRADRRRAGLDRLRRRRPLHDRAVLVTAHGRATPLVWMSVEKARLKGRRNIYEDTVLAAAARGPAPRGEGHGPGGPRVWRPEAVCAPHRPGLRLHHPLSRDGHGGESRRRGASGARVGAAQRQDPATAGRARHDRPLPGRLGGVRQGARHEGRVVPRGGRGHPHRARRP